MNHQHATVDKGLIGGVIIQWWQIAGPKITNIYFHGGFKTRVKAQDNETVAGKNIEIDNKIQVGK